MRLTLHATRSTPHGASRLVRAMSAWSVKTRHAPSRHCRGARVYGHTTTAMHDNEYTTPPIETALIPGGLAQGSARKIPKYNRRCKQIHTHRPHVRCHSRRTKHIRGEQGASLRATWRFQCHLDLFPFIRRSGGSRWRAFLPATSSNCQPLLPATTASYCCLLLSAIASYCCQLLVSH